MGQAVDLAVVVIIIIVQTGTIGRLAAAAVVVESEYLHPVELLLVRLLRTAALVAVLPRRRAGLGK
jgi:hypothetical protein